MNLVALLGLAVVVFASTNIDDIFVLLRFLADPQFRLRNVAIGQYIGIGVLVIVSVVASLISLILAAEYVGLLGILPVLIGVTKLFAPLKVNGGEEGPRREARGGSIAQALSVATVTMASGGDNIGIYSPLFATQSPFATIIIVIVFAILTGLWIAIAHALVSHRAFGAQIRRYGHIAVPLVLIGLGFYILCNAGSLQLIRSMLVAWNISEESRLIGNPIVIGGIPLPSDAPLFLAFIGLHVTAGLICAIAGVVAMLSRKQHGRHPQAGTIYYHALAVVFVTMTMLSISRWADDYHLFALGSLSFAAATIGRTARRRLWPAWARIHMTGMGASYILLITAFYVDNGPNLPLWRELPQIAFWILPALVGAPILLNAFFRHPLTQR